MIFLSQDANINKFVDSLLCEYWYALLWVAILNEFICWYMGKQLLQKSVIILNILSARNTDALLSSGMKAIVAELLSELQQTQTLKFDLQIGVA